MKDSGIPWIGEIPEGWEVKRLKTFAAINPQIELDPDEFHEDAQVSFIPMENLRAGFHAITPIDFSKVKTGYVSFANGDILMAKVTPCYENGNIAVARNLANGIGFGSTEILVFRTTDIDRQFLFYYLQNPAFKGKAISEMYGVAGLKRLTPSFFENSHYPYPTRSEQKRIAAYLDEKCGEIDRVIAAKERQNEMLREQRAAVIHEAVTKGLNPKAKFKESGYEWIGRVPKDWKVLKLRYVGSCQNGISKSGDLFGSGFPFVSYGDVYQNEVLPESVAGLVESTPEDQENYCVRDGDVFFTRTSETIEEIGLTSVCMKTIEKATFAGFLIRFRPFAGMLDKMFSKYYFRCIMHRGFFVKEMNIVTRASLGQDLLKKLPVLLPSPPEQQQIAAYLDARCGEIDRVVAANEGMVAKLKEYRASLIWEAVTGKVAV